MSTSAPQPAEREISYEEALAEGGKEFNSGATRPRPGQASAPVQEPPQTIPEPQVDQAAEEASTAEEQVKEEIDILAPKSGARQWTFGRDDPGSGLVARTYIQRELSVIAKTQWFSLVGEVLDKALGGENSLSLNSLLTPPEVRPGSGGSFRVQDFQDADTFVHAIGKLLVFAPEFLEKSVCIWLSVPDYEWDLVRELMRNSPDLGGLSDDDAEEIIATFIDQNYKSLNAFFRSRYGNLRDRWQARARENQSRSPRR